MPGRRRRLLVTETRFISDSPGLFAPAAEDWFCYIYLAIYIYIIPRFDPLPTSLLTLGTGLGLLLFLGRAPRYLAFYRGKARTALIELAAVFLIPIPLTYLYLGRGQIKFMFVWAALLIALSAGRASSRRDPKASERLLIAYGVILLVSMFWFLSTYFSDQLYNLHLHLYQETDPYILFTGQRSGLVQDLHTFGYQLAVLSMFLITGCLASRGRRRLLFIALAVCAGLTVFLTGERSLIAAIGAGTCALGLKYGSRRRMFLVGLLVAMILASIIMRHNPAELVSRSSQLSLETKLKSARMQSEMFDRFRLQWEGALLIIDYPQGLVLAGKNWVDVISHRAPSLFRTWGRIIGVHNGYLGTVIMYGVPMLLVVVFVLYALVTIAFNLLSVRGVEGRIDWQHAALGSALIASLVQAMFHSASFLTLESSSVAVVFLSMAAYSRLLYDRGRPTRQ